MTLLFTAFEPSGDEHAAPVIARLRAERPETRIYAMGGAKMAAAGATMLARSADHGVMGLSALGAVAQHRVYRRQAAAFMAENPLAALVPVDSPAANWGLCRLMRKLQPDAKIVHLVAPQIWAWATWRIRRMRRLSDHALCLLPFEPAWFAERGVSATFVGHPQFDPGRAAPTTATSDTPLPQGPIRLAILPGSRRHEIERNWPTMLAALAQLQARHAGLVATVAAVEPWAADLVRALAASPGPAGLQAVAQSPTFDIATGATDAVLAWADFVLVTSGTATLQVTRHGKPMVVLYNIEGLTWHLWPLLRLMFATRTFTLPNLVHEHMSGGQRAVTELVPHHGDVAPVVAAVDGLIRDPQAADAQRAALARIRQAFADTPFGDTAARELLRLLG